MYKEILKCRISGSSNLITVLSLGRQYLTGVFPKTKTEQITQGPLDLVWCPESGLLQMKQSYSLDEFYKPVVIEDYAWIGARAMILPGVKIGKGAILGAASTATKDIPDFHVFAGTPAKKIGERNVNLTYRLKYFPFFQ